MKMTRRVVASLLLAAAPLVLFSAVRTPEKPSQCLAFIGTYTTKTESKGIYSYRFDAATGRLSPIGVAVEAQDPSFLAIAPNEKYLYAVNELSSFEGKSSGAVTAYT